jgi:hypothetical protein
MSMESDPGLAIKARPNKDYRSSEVRGAYLQEWEYRKDLTGFNFLENQWGFYTAMKPWIYEYLRYLISFSIF